MKGGGDVLLNKLGQVGVGVGSRLFIVGDGEEVYPLRNHLVDLLNVGRVEVQNLGNGRARILGGVHIVFVSGVGELQRLKKDRDGASQEAGPGRAAVVR